MAEKRDRDQDEESLPPSKLPRTVLVDDARKSAAELLQATFEEVADRLVDALDAGKIAPIILKFKGESPISVYSIPWHSEPLLPMHGAVQEMGDDVANTWFHGIFQAAAARQLQGDTNQYAGAFSFTLDYCETWEESSARQARQRARWEAQQAREGTIDTE